VDESWRATILEVIDVESGPSGSEFPDASELGERIGFDEGDLLFTEEAAGIAAGQKLQTCLPSSQYKSTSNLWNPTASRFERHNAASSLSYLNLEKQAAERDTPGTVTKLIGTVTPRSR